MTVWPSRPRPPLTEQVQCPDCGAHGATARLELRDPQTGKPVRQGTGFAALAGLIVFFVLGNLVNALFGTANPTLALCLTLGFTVVAWFGTALWLTTRQTRGIRVHRYKCISCGYRWDWREDTPVPRHTGGT